MFSLQGSIKQIKILEFELKISNSYSQMNKAVQKRASKECKAI